MKKYTLSLVLTALFCFWVALSNLSLFLFGDSLPVLVTNLLSVAYFIFIPLVPIFKPLGLVEGQMFVGPTPLGLVFGTFIYGVILFGILSLIVGRKKSP